MTRKEERELRGVRAAEESLAGVLVNWGIEMDDHVDSTIQGFAFAQQIGQDEAVEYNEVYAMLRDIALEAYNAGRRETDVPLLAEYRPLRAEIDDLPRDRNIPVTEDAWKREHAAYEGGEDYSELSGRRPRLVAVEWTDPTETPSERMERFDKETHEAYAEVFRLRTIIQTAYSNQGWDIGSMKNLLLPGLDGYENSGWAEYLKTKPGAVFGAAEYEVGYDPTSSRDSWWVTISLMGDHGERGTYTMTDIEGEQMALKIYERIEEGKKRFNE